MKSTAGCNIKKLDLFLHQVSGHHCFFVYDNNKLCKPLHKQEHHVYQNFPPSLQEFLPKLYGVVKVYFHEENDDITCFALPVGYSDIKDAKQFKHCLQHMGIINEQTGDNSFSDVEKGLFASNQNMLNYNEVWVSSMKERLMRKLRKKSDSSEIEEFVLLEDVSKDFKCPCVIDFKMGTRGFGDKDTKEKKASKQKRVDESTSGSLGVRFCGMQVYHVVSEEYVLTNKYKGREYKEHDFELCIRSFLFNGSTYRSEIIKLIIEKLTILRDRLISIDGYRFYCSSLLLIYEGDVNERPHVEIRMIDFAKSIAKSDQENYHVGPDNGYILGVTSLINIFETIDNKIPDVQCVSQF